MKKLVVLGTALLALNAVASEVQIKAGYDFNRRAQSGADTNLNDFKFNNGPVVGLEYIFDNQGEFEWGLGAEYKLSNNSGSLTSKEARKEGTNRQEKKLRTLRTAPVYALGKFNVITTKSGNDALYVLGRAGYGFVAESKNRDGIKPGYHASGGLYTAAGIGTEYGPVSVEALYERQDVKNVRERDAINTFGVRLGYRFGKLVNDRQPKVVERTVERVVERVVQVPVPTPAPAPRTITNNTVALPFSCSAEEKVCVIRGFKVDGREPNAQEASDLRAIANVINQFAEGGSINFVGHTDSTGSAAYNQKLSVARAQNVARLLKEYGLKDTISYGSITGKGLTQPADTNATTEGKYNNRRVELFFNNVDFSDVNFVR